MRRHAPDEVEMRRGPEPLGPLFESLSQPILAPVDTRAAARASVAEATSRLRQAVLRTVNDRGPSTADEIAEALGETVLAIRPRVTELGQDGLLFDTGNRRRNTSGRMARVWDTKAPAAEPIAGITDRVMANLAARKVGN